MLKTIKVNIFNNEIIFCCVFQHLDLTQHKLIYEGTLTHKKQPREQLHGLLFETMVVLLHKQVKNAQFYRCIHFQWAENALTLLLFVDFHLNFHLHYFRTINTYLNI